MPSKLRVVGFHGRARARRQAEDGATGLRLARAGFADDAELLATEREGDAAHRLHRSLGRAGR